MAATFTKTQKGQSEIEHRGGGLTPRARRVLIFVDGKRTVDDLRPMVNTDDLTQTLGLLEEEGYIEALAAQDKAGQTKAATGEQAPKPAISFRELQETDPIDLAKARNFMNNTINVFAGSVGTSTLIDHIQNAQSHEDLRAVFDDWYYVIVSSRDGKREADGLREKLLEVI
jgi:hypothetical protein